jgi:hypothetical protein
VQRHCRIGGVPTAVIVNDPSLSRSVLAAPSSYWPLLCVPVVGVKGRPVVDRVAAVALDAHHRNVATMCRPGRGVVT